MAFHLRATVDDSTLEFDMLENNIQTLTGYLFADVFEDLLADLYIKIHCKNQLRTRFRLKILNKIWKVNSC